MNEIIVLEKLNPVAIFSGELDNVLNKIAEEAKSLVLDVSTQHGRKEIASQSFNVAKSKTFLDDMGKKLGEEARAKINAINADRKRAWDFLENLQKEVRKPLTEFEEKEKARIAQHETELTLLSPIMSSDPTISEIVAEIDLINGRHSSRNWEEFKARADAAHKQSIENLLAEEELRKKRDAEHAELARLRAEQAERELQEAERQRMEREEQIKREAAEAARIAAEEKAASEIAAQKASEEKAKREAEEAHERARKAEEARIASEERAKADSKEAAERAERKMQAAVEAERQRAAAAAKAEADAAVKREADKKHKARINNEILVALAELDCVLGKVSAKAIVIAIAEGKIPHVKILY